MARFKRKRRMKKTFKRVLRKFKARVFAKRVKKIVTKRNETKYIDTLLTQESVAAWGTGEFTNSAASNFIDFQAVFFLNVVAGLQANQTIGDKIFMKSIRMWQSWEGPAQTDAIAIDETSDLRFRESWIQPFDGTGFRATIGSSFSAILPGFSQPWALGVGKVRDRYWTLSPVVGTFADGFQATNTSRPSTTVRVRRVKINSIWKSPPNINQTGFGGTGANLNTQVFIGRTLFYFAAPQTAGGFGTNPRCQTHLRFHYETLA